MPTYIESEKKYDEKNGGGKKPGGRSWWTVLFTFTSGNIYSMLRLKF